MGENTRTIQLHFYVTEKVIIPHSGKHESAGRKTSIRGEENTNPRKERSNSPKERTSCRI